MSPYVMQGEWKEAAVSALWDAVSDCLCEIEVRSVWWRRVALRIVCDFIMLPVE